MGEGARVRRSKARREGKGKREEGWARREAGGDRAGRRGERGQFRDSAQNRCKIRKRSNATHLSDVPLPMAVEKRLGAMFMTRMPASVSDRESGGWVSGRYDPSARRGGLSRTRCSLERA